jgi:glycosyltransferase involved in cell wall biosynthesis
MSNNKLKVLMCSEASFVNSGFGNYTRELLNRLYDTNKYDIAEFASYGMVNDPRDRSIRWKYYANAVKDNDPRHKEYSSRGDNQFGRWRFEKVLLDFKPNVVIDIRDYWMNSYQALSPLRPYFNWVLMPTVDSAPQQEEWIDTFISADAVFTYSDWGADVLKRQSNNRINFINTASPGVNLNVFKIKDNISSIKKNLGLPEKSFIVGSVMRNQKRKLIPELFSAFRSFLDELISDGHPMSNNTYLYLHTSYPDAGWDIPELLKHNRLLNKVFFTYHCPKCKTVESCVFSHPTKMCKKCMEPNSRFTSVTNGVSDDILADIYNTFDVYVQYAICEGFGMPQVEAGACGVPIATVDYSAMSDVVKKLDAHPVKVRSFFKELETKAIRVYPDNNDLVKFLLKTIRLSPDKRNKQRHHTRKLAVENYNWDNISKIWENFLDKPELFTAKRSWNSPPKFLKEISDISDNISGKDKFLKLFSTCAENLDNIEFMSELIALDMSRDSDYGFSQNGMSFSPYTIANAMQSLQSLINNNNQAEHVRSNNLKIEEDFLQYAHIKANI